MTGRCGMLGAPLGGRESPAKAGLRVLPGREEAAGQEVAEAPAGARGGDKVRPSSPRRSRERPGYPCRAERSFTGAASAGDCRPRSLFPPSHSASGLQATSSPQPWLFLPLAVSLPGVSSSHTLQDSALTPGCLRTAFLQRHPSVPGDSGRIVHHPFPALRFGVRQARAASLGPIPTLSRPPTTCSWAFLVLMA